MKSPGAFRFGPEVAYAMDEFEKLAKWPFEFVSDVFYVGSAISFSDDGPVFVRKICNEPAFTRRRIKIDDFAIGNCWIEEIRRVFRLAWEIQRLKLGKPWIRLFRKTNKWYVDYILEQPQTCNGVNLPEVLTYPKQLMLDKLGSDVKRKLVSDLTRVPFRSLEEVLNKPSPYTSL